MEVPVTAAVQLLWVRLKATTEGRGRTAGPSGFELAGAVAVPLISVKILETGATHGSGTPLVASGVVA